MLQRDLIAFGLTEKEAEIYIALLKLEVATVNEIAKVSHVNRSSAYVSLESLKKRGLVGITQDKKVRQYIAASPDVLLRTVEDQIVKKEIVKKNIAKTIPQMKALFKGTRRRPLISIFEGKQGVIDVLSKTLYTSEKEVRVCSSAKMLFEVIPEFLPVYADNRVKYGVHLKAIFPLTEKSDELISIMPKLYNAAYIPESKYAIQADIAIWDSNVAYSFTQDDLITSIIIESPEVASFMKVLFDMAYLEACKIGVKKKNL